MLIMLLYSSVSLAPVCCITDARVSWKSVAENGRSHPISLPISYTLGVPGMYVRTRRFALRAAFAARYSLSERNVDGIM